MYSKIDSLLSKTFLAIASLILLLLIGFFGLKLWKIRAADIPFSVDTSKMMSIATSSPSAKSSGEVVAAKNGKVYYLPTCTAAKRISPQNLRRFKTSALAQAAGLKPSSSCK